MVCCPMFAVVLVTAQVVAANMYGSLFGLQGRPLSATLLSALLPTAYMYVPRLSA